MLTGQDLASKNGSAADGGQLPQPFVAAFRSSALAGESPIAWLETDLDAELHFAHGLVLLTNRRLLSFPSVTNATPPRGEWSEWNVVPTLSATAHVHAGVGSLELFEGETEEKAETQQQQKPGDRRGDCLHGGSTLWSRRIKRSVAT